MISTSDSNHATKLNILQNFKNVKYINSFLNDEILVEHQWYVFQANFELIENVHIVQIGILCRNEDMQQQPFKCYLGIIYLL